MKTHMLRSGFCWYGLADLGQHLIRSLASPARRWPLFSSCHQPFQSIATTVSHESFEIVASSWESTPLKLLGCASTHNYGMRRQDCLSKNQSFLFRAFESTPLPPKKITPPQSVCSYLDAQLLPHTSACLRFHEEKTGFKTKDKSALHRSFSFSQLCRWKSYALTRHLHPQAISAHSNPINRVSCRFSIALSSAFTQPVREEEDLDAEVGLERSTGTPSRAHKSSLAEDWEGHDVVRDESDIEEERNGSLEDNLMEQSDVYIPVEAFFIARSVDLKSLSEEPFVDVVGGRKHLVIRCRDHSDESSGVSEKIDRAAEDNWSFKRYMVVFQWGSVVLFNFGSPKEDDSLNIVKKHCKDMFKEEIKENYGVLVRPTLDRYSQGGHDKIMVKTLDTNGLRIISLILSQSIALDHYTKAIDSMLTSFGELNRTMEMTGNFKLHRKELFQLVAAANTTLADAILRIGLLERSDVAWQNANYDRIWVYLREDFELDERFESLEFKTGIIQHNVKFFLDILQNRKSDLLEWIIIFLITGEIMVSLYDILHGTGAL